MIYYFEKLEIWQLSIELSIAIYKRTKDFPPEERYGITSQLRRSVTSVTANIAEGSSRIGLKDKARFFQIAYSSLMEVLNFIILSERLLLINTEELASFRVNLEELSNKINAYHKKIPV